MTFILVLLSFWTQKDRNGLSRQLRSFVVLIVFLYSLVCCGRYKGILRPCTLCSALKMLRPKMLHPEIQEHYSCFLRCCKLAVLSRAGTQKRATDALTKHPRPDTPFLFYQVSLDFTVSVTRGYVCIISVGEILVNLRFYQGKMYPGVCYPMMKEYGVFFACHH